MSKPGATEPRPPLGQSPSYWRCVLRFGLPFAALFALAGYLTRRFRVGTPALPWPWGVEAVIDACLMFLAGGLWWWLTHQIHDWKQRNTPTDDGTPFPR
jgi:hypothetical protein